MMRAPEHMISLGERENELTGARFSLIVIGHEGHARIACEKTSARKITGTWLVAGFFL